MTILDGERRNKNCLKGKGRKAITFLFEKTSVAN